MYRILESLFVGILAALLICFAVAFVIMPLALIISYDLSPLFIPSWVFVCVVLIFGVSYYFEGITK